MTAVKFLHSDMVGAPTITPTAGTLINVLDACLVNGFGTGNVDSVVVAGGIATVTRSAGHPMEIDCIAEIAGATPAGLNGQKRVLSVPTIYTYTFDATGISDQTATGAITHKLAPLGWVKQYSATNLAAYKSSNVAATGSLLRVDDTDVLNARVVGYESMTGISDNLVGPFPTAAQVSGGAYITKSNNTSMLNKSWIVVGDDRAFYVWIQYGSTASLCHSYFFGDTINKKSPDPYSASLIAPTGVANNNPTFTVARQTASSNGTQWMPRGVTGLGASQALRRNAVTPVDFNGSASYSGAAGLAYPNPGDNGLYLVPIALIDTSAGTCYRADMPGLYFVPQIVGTGVFTNRERLTGIPSLPGRVVRNIAETSGPLFVDVTGPWR